MNWLYFLIGISWVGFWVYWIIAAVHTGIDNAEQHRRQRLVLILVFVILLSLFFKVLKLGALTVHHHPYVKALGALIFYAGLLLAVWARRTIGSSWGLPMTTHDNPKIISSGPFRFIRHPMYSGLLLMALGSGIVLSRVWLFTFAVSTCYGFYIARQEEKLLSHQLPKTYPPYKKRTKMFVPFII